jgi:hypothetical protein
MLAPGAAAIETAGSWDRRPEPKPIPARKSHRCILSQGTKAFLDELHEFSCICWDNCVRYSVAQLQSRERGGLPEPDRTAVIEDRTTECFRIPFRRHRQLQCSRLSNEVHCAMAKQP